MRPQLTLLPLEKLIAISDEFGLSLDELIKGDVAVKKKIIADSSAKKWHIFATLFMLFFELRIFIKERIYRQDKNDKTEK
ncbi:MAG: hypothetical protein ACI4U1_04130 [Anaerovoracaceae bacterium]